MSESHNSGVGVVETGGAVRQARSGQGRGGGSFGGKVLIGIRCYLHSKKYYWTGKVAHWVRTLVVKPDDLSSIPQSHKVKGENQFTHKIDVFGKW